MRMQRHLFVVPRDRVDLVRLLAEQFPADSGVEVVLDRRQSDRRVAARPVLREQRRGERRVSDEVRRQLERSPYAFLTLPDGP